MSCVCATKCICSSEQIVQSQIAIEDRLNKMTTRLDAIEPAQQEAATRMQGMETLSYAYDDAFNNCTHRLDRLENAIASQEQRLLSVENLCNQILTRLQQDRNMAIVPEDSEHHIMVSINQP